MGGIKVFAAVGGVLALVAVGFAIAEAGPARATHVEGATHVYVNNPTGEPIPVRDMSGREPFTVSLSGLWNSGDKTSSKAFTVPSGKRLVVEYVSVNANVPTGQRVRGYLYGNSTPVAASFLLFTREGSFGTYDVFVAAQPTRAYLNAGASSLVIQRSSDAGLTGWSGSVVGYLIPA
jgi:hypothetical protein